MSDCASTRLIEVLWDVGDTLPKVRETPHSETILKCRNSRFYIFQKLPLTIFVLVTKPNIENFVISKKCIRNTVHSSRFAIQCKRQKFFLVSL